MSQATRCRARSTWASTSRQRGARTSTIIGGADAMRPTLSHTAAIGLVICSMAQVSAVQKYDLLLKDGHLIDPRNRISAVRDVAIPNGKVAEDAANIDPAEAFKIFDVSGHYVTRRLV